MLNRVKVHAGGRLSTHSLFLSQRGRDKDSRAVLLLHVTTVSLVFIVIYLLYEEPVECCVFRCKIDVFSIPHGGNNKK